MRVGVLLDPNNINNQANVGGGYTFEQEVFKAFLDLAAHNQNEFVVFVAEDVAQEISQVEDIEFISLAHEWKKVSLVAPALLKVLFDRIKFAKIYFTQSIINNLKYEVNHRILKSYEIDIVWSLSPSNITLDIPYIMTLWDLAHRNYPYFPEVSSGMGWDGREYAFTTPLRRATYVVTGTQVGKSEIQRNYQVSSDRIKVLPFPTPQFALDSKLVNPQEKLEQYGLEFNSYLFYPAQFWAHKNHANLLYAVKLLNDYYDLKFPVVFVGSDKKNMGYIKQLVEDLDLQPQVHFLGFVKQEDLIALYQGAFALTFMSFFGPDNLPPLEAFALGCPVIASNVPGVQEQLGDAALLVNPSDDKQIALAIKSLYEDSNLRQKLTQRGYERAAQWTSQDYVRGIFGILEEFQAIRRCWLVD
jgi:glycosyltransferase involved in cell wall biosynthesis